MLFDRRKWFGLIAAAFAGRKAIAKPDAIAGEVLAQVSRDGYVELALPAAHVHTCALCEDISGVQIMRIE